MELHKAAAWAQITGLVSLPFGAYCAYAAWVTLNQSTAATTAVPASGVPTSPSNVRMITSLAQPTSTGVLIAFGAFVALLVVAAILGALSLRERRANRGEAARFERKLDEGDFWIKVHQKGVSNAGVGRILWRDAQLSEARSRGDAMLSPADLARAYESSQGENREDKPLTPLRALERFYMALVSLREHVEHLKKMENIGGSSPVTAFIDVAIALGKIRKELVDLSPELFTTSEAFDFRETVWTDPDHPSLSDERVPKEIDHLMKTIYRHWSRRGEALGITPLRFKATPVVELRKS